MRAQLFTFNPFKPLLSGNHQSVIRSARFRGQEPPSEEGPPDTYETGGVQSPHPATEESNTAGKGQRLEIRQINPDHPYAPYKEKEALEIASIFERVWNNHVILVEEDTSLLQGVLAALSKLYEQTTPLLQVDLAQYEMAPEDTRDFIDQVIELTSEQHPEQFPPDKSRPFFLVVKNVSVHVQEVMTNPEYLGLLTRQYPNLRLILSMDPNQKHETDEIDKEKSLPEIFQKYLKMQMQPFQKTRICYDAQQGNFEYVPISPLKAKEFVDLVKTGDSLYSDILSHWGLEFSDKALEEFHEKLKAHYAPEKLNPDKLLSAFDTFGQFINEKRSKKTYQRITGVEQEDVRYPKITTQEVTQFFSKFAAGVGLATHRRTLLDDTVKPFPTKVPVSPYAGLRPEKIQWLQTILQNRRILQHAILESESGELNKAILQDLRKQLPESIPMYELDMKQLSQHPGSLNELPQLATRLKGKGRSKGNTTPIILVLQDLNSLQVAQLTSPGFQKLLEKSPQLRLILTCKPEALEEQKFPYFLFGIEGPPESSQNNKWYRERFEVLHVPPMGFEDWQQWMVNKENKDLQDFLKKGNVQFTVEGRDAFLATLCQENNELPFDEKHLYKELDAFCSYLKHRGKKGTQGAGFSRIQREKIEAYTREIIRRRGPDTHQTIGGTNASAFTIVRPGEIKITLNDIIGQERAKESLRRVAQVLEYPNIYQAFQQAKDRANRKMVILAGPPGSGKTLLAQGLAGELKTKFIYTSGAQFVNTYVGKGADNVRKLFDQLGEKTIIFIDEAEVAFPSRKDSGSDHSEDDKTVGQFLALTDGITRDNRNVLIVLATNHKEKLDQAVWDRCHYKVDVNLPNAADRKLMIEKQISLNQLNILGAVNYDTLINQTKDISGREIGNIMEQIQFRLMSKENKVKLNRLNRSSPRTITKFKLNIEGKELTKEFLEIWNAIKKSRQTP